MNNDNQKFSILSRLSNILEKRKPTKNSECEKSYVTSLLVKGPDSILKKIGEESTELVMAAKDGLTERIISETADLWFHCLVLLTYYGIRPEDIMHELERREGLSGIEEKENRYKNKDC
ncbi:phosphoribosyl-ATP pyrophosphohydrolase [Candidatus Kinetoplastibacterium desouzaii TCC079E]|uniref:Phosphoribosyl-ATP pyrophosphatase n=1 Tax=Candidatus Kinetoplastidibacterium desouzai TCC079E TaxID=1208919 RepID=M1L1B9_9PROT|nr:phosphoribosyl-ATP diphosphatase [Candidatus Kinetoplastibacterium desouzaii]AGF46578.1 phosphoribosyl-ATP pyrophosphohydrolase [Candidatus Kinetoplastibacterium desouzaii TCC079E]